MCADLLSLSRPPRSNDHAVLARVLKCFVVVKKRVFWACAHLRSCYCKGVTLRSRARVLKVISRKQDAGLNESDDRVNGEI